MPQKPWRFRQCPECLEVFPAGKLRMLGLGPYWATAGAAPRTCPACNYIGETNEFQIVQLADVDREEA